MKSFPVIDSFDKVSVNALGKGKIITGNDYGKILLECHVNKEMFVSELGGQLIRRKNATGYHYFFTMLKNKPVDGWVTLGIDAESAMFFDPMTGQKGKAALRKQNGKTEVYMQLQPGESIILKTFTKTKITTDNWAYYQPAGDQTELKDGWEMNFVESEPAIDETFKLHTLGSWTELNNDTLKKNMGTARYTIKFDFKKPANEEYRLCLGDVRESARVRVNGKEAGTLFAVPFETNIGQLLVNGENTLEIEATNLPANRIADYDKRGVEWRMFQEINFVSITYKDVRFDTWNPVPSGLLGPVIIKELRKIQP